MSRLNEENGSVKCRWEKHGTNIGPFMAHKLPKIGPGGGCG